MERAPEYIVCYCEFTKRFRVHRFHITLNGVATYKAIPGLAYEHAEDAVRGASEVRPVREKVGK